MSSAFVAPRRKTVFGGRYNVAADTRLGCGIAALMPVTSFLGVCFVLLSPAYLETHSGDSVALIMLIVFSLTLVSEVFLFLVMTCDPGFLPPGELAPLSHFCPVCLLEVDEFCHHCPLVSSCIGKGNYRYFVSFLCSAAGLCSTGVAVAGQYCREIANETHLVAKLRESWVRAPWVFVKIAMQDHTHLLLWPIFFLCVAAACLTLALAAGYCFFVFTRKHAIQRRRRRCLGGGVRAVFADYMHPRFTDPVFIRQCAEQMGDV